MQTRVPNYLRFAVLLMGLAGLSLACNVPVFRYAMEKWPADPYPILVYHHGDSPGEAFQALRKGAANFSLKSIDVTTPEGKSVAGKRGIVVHPWVEVYYPLQGPARAPVWSGPLTLARARRILNSPGRSRLARTLLSGDVAVWILVKSGHEEKDRRALETLKTHLDWASANLRIPDSGADAAGNPIAITDFKSYPVRFSQMEVAHDDPDEELLVKALLNSEPDLGGYGEPMAFPVFGRGRALYALVGDGIQEKNIREACQSMLAWCSCEIKAQNPGTDLLIAADWSRPFGGRMVKDAEAPLTGLSGFLPDPKPALPVALPEPPPAPRPAPSPLKRNVLYLAAGAGAALLAVSLFLRMKAKR